MALSILQNDVIRRYFAEERPQEIFNVADTEQICILTLNRSGFSESGRPGRIPPPCVTSLTNDHEIWWCHTVSKARPENNKMFDDVTTMTFL